MSLELSFRSLLQGRQISKWRFYTAWQFKIKGVNYKEFSIWNDLEYLLNFLLYHPPPDTSVTCKNFVWDSKKHTLQSLHSFLSTFLWITEEQLRKFKIWLVSCTFLGKIFNIPVVDVQLKHGWCSRINFPNLTQFFGWSVVSLLSFHWLKPL